MNHIELMPYDVLFYKRSQNFEERLLASSCLSVRLSIWNNLPFTGRIFMKFYICVFFENLLSERFIDRLCGLVVRVSSYRSRGPGFDPRRYQIFWVVVGLKRGPLSLVRSMKKVAAPGLENGD